MLKIIGLTAVAALQMLAGTVYQSIVASNTPFGSFPAASAAFRNIGQTNHMVIFSLSDNGGTCTTFEGVKLSLQGSIDGSTWFRFASTNASLNSLGPYVLRASGYYPYVRTTITSQGLITNCGMTAFYTGTTEAVSETRQDRSNAPMDFRNVQIVTPNAYVMVNGPTDATGSLVMNLRTLIIYNPGSAATFAVACGDNFGATISSADIFTGTAAPGHTTWFQLSDRSVLRCKPNYQLYVKANAANVVLHVGSTEE